MSEVALANRESLQAASALRAWYLVAVLTLFYALSFVDRQIMSLLVGPMKHEFALSDTRIGLLQGFAFASFYTLMGFPLGRFADTGDRRGLIAGGIVLWSAMTSLCGTAKSFFSLFLARMGVGVGEATLSPAAFSLISDSFSPGSLGVAFSVYSMGISIGSGVALLVGGSLVSSVLRMNAVSLPFLGTFSSWRLTFFAVGLPGLLFAPLIKTVKDPNRRNLMRASDGRPLNLGLAATFREFRRRWQSITGMSFAIVFQSVASYAFFAWAPEYFQRVHGWTVAQAGHCLGAMVIFCCCSGTWVGGALCDYWVRKGMYEGPLRVGVLSAIGAGVLFAFALTAPQFRWSWEAMAPGLFFISLPGGSAYAALQLILPNQVRGQISAIFLFILNIGGLSLGPLLPAILNDYVFKNESMIGVSTALTMGLACTLVIATLPRIYKPYRRDFLAMHSRPELRG